MDLLRLSGFATGAANVTPVKSAATRHNDSTAVQIFLLNV